MDVLVLSHLEVEIVRMGMVEDSPKVLLGAGTEATLRSSCYRMMMWSESLRGGEADDFCCPLDDWMRLGEVVLPRKDYLEGCEVEETDPVRDEAEFELVRIRNSFEPVDARLSVDQGIHGLHIVVAASTCVMRMIALGRWALSNLKTRLGVPQLLKKAHSHDLHPHEYGTLATLWY